MFEPILLLIDPSRESFTVFNKTIDLARSHKSRMIKLSVEVRDRDELNNPKSKEALRRKTRELIEQVGFNCDVIEREGKPPFVICDLSDEIDVDVIVMGSQQRSLDGDGETTTARVIQIAPCPILVIP